MSARRYRRARDRALGWNRGLIWERSVGGPGRAEVASPSALALGGWHGRRAPRAVKPLSAGGLVGTGARFSRFLHHV